MRGRSIGTDARSATDSAGSKHITPEPLGPDVSNDDAQAVETLASASDAFQALAGEPRVSVIRALAAAPTGRETFTELFEATDVDTTAGFAYHLRQLDGHYLRPVDADGDASVYELTAAGQRVARALASGAYTRRAAARSFPIADRCPRCHAGGERPVASVDDGTGPSGSPASSGLRGTIAADVATVRCDACGHEPLSVRIPPASVNARSASALSATVDAHAKRRLRSFTDGVCPDCGGAVTGGITDGSPAVSDETASERGVRARFTCSNCATSHACPLSHVLRSHPAVVAAYHDHGIDVRERPLWAIDADWRAVVLSRDPWCLWLGVADPGDDDDDDDRRDVLGAYVDGDLSVAGVERLDDADADARGRITPAVADDATPEESPSEDGTPA